MDGALSAPVLESTLGRLLARERRRRRDAALRRTLAATWLAVLVVAAWRIFDRVMGREPLPLSTSGALIAFVALVGLAFAIRAATCRSEREMAREVDRRLALDDRVASALSLVRQPGPSRLAAFVVGDVERTLHKSTPLVDALFPVKPERRTSGWTRASMRVALVFVALAVLAELIGVVGLIRLLPGGAIGGDGRLEKEKPSSAPEPKSGPTAKRDEGPKPSPSDPRREPPQSAPPEGSVHLSMKMSKEEYDAGEPVTAAVTATATGEIVGARELDVRVDVDGSDVDTGTILNLDPSRPEGDRAEIDLRRLPDLSIEPGEHVARARLTTRTTHEEHVSPPVKFRVRAPKKDDASNKGGAPKPKPEPQKQPLPQPKSEDPKKKEEPQSSGETLPPPVALEKKVVVPLFGQGDEVKKRGVILVLDPGGGIENPPSTRPLDEALPDARRRAESEVDRAGTRQEDRELVRRYFELLEALRR